MSIRTQTLPESLWFQLYNMLHSPRDKYIENTEHFRYQRAGFPVYAKLLTDWSSKY